MWNPDEYLRTLLFAGKAHYQQKVPGTEMSYVVHITNVAMEVANALILSNDKNLDATFAIQCALLHDTIEDTAITYQDIVQEFDQRVADGVLALTKNESLPKEEQMLDSLNRIVQQGAEIRIVKMADRINNLQPPPHYWNNAKKIKYQAEAQLILDKLKGVNPAIEQRLEQKIKDYQHYMN